jgi:uncharacterized protein YjbI with pentapeptide repeats
MQYSVLESAKFTDAILVKADLHGADLTHTDLTNANLAGANLTAVDLSTAIQAGTNFADTTTSKAQIPERGSVSAKLLKRPLLNKSIAP